MGWRRSKWRGNAVIKLFVRAADKTSVALKGHCAEEWRWPVADTLASTIKLLLVDDSKFLRLATERALQRAGYEVFTATDGERALEIAARNSRT